MKRIYASLGVAAIGMAAIQNVQGQSSDPSRAWSVSASLRGFYDDNVNTTPDNELETFGVEISPTLAYNLTLEQTTISASYNYAYKWYEKDINSSGDQDDQTHTFAARLRHAFSERVLLSVQDSFVVGQEPEALQVGDATSEPQRISGDNIRNYGSIILNWQVSRQAGIEVGYANALANYDADINSQTLDRLEHMIHIDGRWNLQPDTVGIVGYQFRIVDYTADLPIGSLAGPPVEVLYSDSRNSRMHYGYVGLEHKFRPDLMASVRGGLTYADYYNSPDSDTSVSPYGKAALTYTYAKESNLEVGVSHDLNATDQFSVDNQSITQDAESTVAYVSVKHQILPNFYGSAIGTYQYSVFNGGDLDGEADSYYIFGVNLEYRFNRHFSADAGYNYNKLDSASGSGQGDYDRNQVYLGATFIY